MFGSVNLADQYCDSCDARQPSETVATKMASAHSSMTRPDPRGQRHDPNKASQNQQSTDQELLLPRQSGDV
jgi:hypothetical protein